MKKVIFFIALFFLAIGLAGISWADDTDIYDIADNVKPNVLIIFDNSGSMSAGVSYNDGDTYAGSYNNGPTDRYRRQCLRWGWFSCRTWGPWEVYTGAFTDNNNDGIHDSDTNIRRGNRLNYDYGDYDTRLGVAKAAIKDIIDLSKAHVRFGIMVLNAYRDINHGATFPQYHNDTTILSSTYGGAIIQDRTDAEIETLKGYIDDMTADGGTPLANRLINAALYFRGDFGSYASPIDATNWCRKNFIILMTDGKPEGEGNSLSADDDGDYDHIEDFLDGNPGSRDVDNDNNDPDPTNDYENGGSDYLDDVAKYLHDTDDSLDPTHAVSGDQNLTIYTIGFHVDHQLLTDAATNGGGDYYTASSCHDLAYALETVMESIIDRAQTFTAPVVPVQRTTSGDIMYVSLFTPKAHDNFWPGYLIKLKIGDDGELLGFLSGYGTGDPVQVTDAEGTLSENLINPDEAPYPYWDAHNTLKNRASVRNIYTYTGTTADLNNSSNLFVTTNTAITATMLDNPTKQSSANPTTTVREDLINYIHGKDAYDEDVDSDYTDKRENILGDILHSQPLVIDYSSTERVIFVGTNDGMLHAFNDTDGSEKWGFIPPDLLPQLKDVVEGPGHQYFVDGSPKAYTLDGNGDGDFLDVGIDKVIVICGERRGGTSYTALDVTDPDDPQYLWRIDNANPTIAGIPNPTTVISELGQTWSEPQIGKVKAGTVGSETPTIVAFIGGGYNESTPSHTKGRGLFIINALTGALVKGYTVADSGTYPVLANMTSCIPSTVLAVDTNFDGYINRVYVGDTGGRMWRFGLHRSNSSDLRVEDGNINNWSPRLLFQTSTGSKIFYPPDLVLEPGYAYLYFGTGDRENPCATSGTNRMFAVKDRNTTSDLFTTMDEGDLVDVTADLIQEGTSEQAEQTLNSLQSHDGWYITMEGTGEKILAAPVVVFGMVLFTTFVPNTDPCSYGGDGYVYAVDYLSGVSVIDFNDDGDLGKSDCKLFIGHGIPTEVVVTISADGTVMAYIGAGGGIFSMELPSSSGNFNVESWREVF